MIYGDFRSRLLGRRIRLVCHRGSSRNLGPFYEGSYKGAVLFGGPKKGTRIEKNLNILGGFWVLRKRPRRLPYFEVLTIRILLFRVPIFGNAHMAFSFRPLPGPKRTHRFLAS